MSLRSANASPSSDRSHSRATFSLCRPELNPSGGGGKFKCCQKMLGAALLPILLLANRATGQTVTATVTAGTYPDAVAVNPVTNKIYVANLQSSAVTVIDGSTNTTTTVATPYACCELAVAVNPVTNKIYVTNNGNSILTVIDGATNTTTNVPIGAAAYSLAVNPVTNKVYVANGGSNSVTVVDGATNTTTTVAVGTDPVSVAVNPVTNKVYVANDGSSNITVIDGATNNTSTVAAQTEPYSVAVNPVSNKIYVTNLQSGSVTVIDGATNNTTTVSVGIGPYSVAVNPVTNKIYVATDYGGVNVIDGATNSTTSIAAATGPFTMISVNPVTNKAYVTDKSTNTLTVIDGATNSTSTLGVGGAPTFVALNPSTDTVYVANSSANSVSVISGATNGTATLATGTNPSYPAVNQVTNKTYIPNENSSNVTVIDGSTNSTTTVPVGAGPTGAVVNPLTNKIYIANSGSNDVTVIDGNSNSTVNVPAGTFPFFLAVNPVTNKIYVANYDSNNLTVIDGVTNNTTTVPVGTNPLWVAVNQITNQVYVANSFSANVTVIDGSSNNVTTVPVGGSPYSVAVNPVTNKIYVATLQSVVVIDGATNNTTVAATGNFPSVAVNPITNKIYAAGGGGNTVAVIDGATNNTTTITAGTNPSFVVVNPTTNKIYVANLGSSPSYSGTVTVVDGATNNTASVPVGSYPVVSLAVNPVTNTVYCTNQKSNNVTIITEQQTQSIPLTTAITPLPNNQSTDPIPAFTFTATSTTVAQSNAMFYQFDTWQGPWTAASGSDPTFTGTQASLQPGFHTLYAYAADGQEATSTQAGSPLVGSIQAYSFLVLPVPPATPTLSVSVWPNGTLTQGHTGEWDIQITNTATASASATSGTTTVIDTLPTGYSLSSYSGTGWACTPATTTVTCTSSQVVNGAVGTFNQLSLIINVPANSAVSVTDNVAAYGGGDPNHASLATAATASSTVTVAQVPATINLTAGNNQSVPINTAFPTNLSVTVLDAGSVAISGANVTFTAPTTGASGTFTGGTNHTTSTTLASGVATATPFTANSTAGGPYNISVTAGSITTNFSETNTASAAATITANPGTTPQTATINTAFAIALSVTVKDAGGNPVPNMNVVFTAPATGPSGLFSNNNGAITAATNASGVASEVFTANANGGGPYYVTASAGSLSTSFSLTNSLLTQTITFGTIPTQNVGIPLTLTATASSTLPVNYSSSTQTVCTVAGSTVTFLMPGGCSITAAQNGNASYSAAQPVTQSFSVVGNIPVISNVQAITVSGNSELITWTTDQPSTTQVNYGLTSAYGSSSPLNSALVTSHSVTISGLSPNTSYNFDVVSTNAASGTATSPNASFATTPYIGYVAFWGVNNSGVTISWSTDLPATSFVAYGITQALGQLSPVQPALTNSHGVILSGLNPGTTYYFMAESTTANGNTGGSAIYSFTTTGTPASPAPVISNVAVSGVTTTSATITWTTDQVSSSQVNYGSTTSYGSSSPLNSNQVTSHSVTLTGLTPGTTYDFDVVSANTSDTAAGMSGNYTFTTATIISTPPTITNVATTGITSNSVTITWTTDQPSWSLVNYGTTTTYGSSSTLNATLVTSHSVTLTGLTAGTSYDFDVVSENAASLSSTSPNATFTTTAANAVPPNVGYLAFWGITNSGVTVSWSTDLPATTQLAYGTTPALGQLTTIQSALTASHGVVLTGLNSGTSYYFVAQSTAANGATGYSTTYSFTTTGTPSSPAPVISNVLVNNIGNNSATITWTTDQAASSQVNYGVTTSYMASSTLDPTLVTSHSVILTNLSPGTTYDFDVMSASSSSQSSTSANYTFATTGSAPGPVISAVAASSVTGGTAVITWTTDQASSSQVNYGATTSYGESSTLDSTLVTSHLVTLTGLTPNTTYNFDVVSANSAHTSSTSTNSIFTTSSASGVPPVVSYLAFWGISSSAVTISWSTNVPANTAVAFGATTALGQLSPVQTTLTNSHGVTLTGLAPSTTYYFVAQSADVTGDTGYSTTYSFTTLPGPPSISAISVTPGANNTAVISWSTSAATYSYVQYGSAAGSYTRYTLQTNLTTAPQCTLTYVPSGVVHYQLVSTGVDGNQTVTPDATFVEP